MPGRKYPMLYPVSDEVRNVLDELPKSVLQDMLAEQLAVKHHVLQHPERLKAEQVRNDARVHLRAHDRARQARGQRPTLATRIAHNARRGL